MASVFETLSKIDCSEHIEKKGRLSYLSWAWAWHILLSKYPDSYYTVYETPEGCFYFTDGRTAWVKTGVTVVDGEKRKELVERLPVMDSRNQSIPLDKITSFAVNTAIQRSLTKAVARHGLGLYIYAGEDLPDDMDKPLEEPKPAYDRRAAELECFTALGLDRGNKEEVQAFGQLLKALKAGKVIPEKTLAEMTDDEHKATMAALRSNFSR